MKGLSVVIWVERDACARRGEGQACCMVATDGLGGGRGGKARCKAKSSVILC